MNGELVVINGIIQSASEYTITSNNQIVFRNAPQSDSHVSIITDDHNRLDYRGDGLTNTFQGPSDDKAKFREFMTEVYKNKDNPSVKDALERLQIVMELVR
mgnify:FL=1